MTERHAEILIVGSGPAGYTAAIYAARAMMKPLLVAGLQEGGQLTITTDVENYPGYADPVQGPWMMEQMKAQALNVGAEMASDLIVSADLDRRPFRLTGDSGTVYTCDALIIATGAQAKWLGLPSEDLFQGFGVSACATCDGFFYRGKDVVVVGGGNTAIEEALYLSHIAKSVTLVHRRDEFRAERILQERVFKADNIEIVWNSEIDEILGETKPMKSVTGVRLRDRVTGETSERATHGVFVAIGHAPAVELFTGKLKQKPSGYLWVEPGTTQTSVPGVFAAGDVADDVYRQAVTAAGMGCMAALEAEKWLAVQAVEDKRQAAE
ncbi:MAG: thioredoxin-disulfide reductase [Aurantimonas coralicida]|uniref:thioredoxin-disulfide reductase n=1 Tax=Aurantimonas TaxID=182269 RepID=UPI001651F694|nr:MULTISPECIES: thioredoxin-disulfide reductase [Aurantimonas]MBC6716221.1 thioredoxin-disulfide reductase [Aurantimonas sp. DM33-3]MCC4299822.1 thioredoxin-disulfide reductase [Aurantimonas coralicida]MCD1642022.1 thioredoxin-disulfide reductase [Aurantimonas coralicida]MDE0924797.1 thioredoxin-disulfide reductase [Aurantimonas coralicida]